jgi:hypothetical protein
VKKLLPGRKPIPTRLVLTIKLQSDGSIDKFKARCVVAGFMQRSGIDYNPDGTYSPMTEAVTVRLLLSIASRLKLRIDHLDIKTAFLTESYQPMNVFGVHHPQDLQKPPDMAGT